MTMVTTPYETDAIFLKRKSFYNEENKLDNFFYKKNSWKIKQWALWAQSFAVWIYIINRRYQAKIVENYCSLLLMNLQYKVLVEPVLGVILFRLHFRTINLLRQFYVNGLSGLHWVTFVHLQFHYCPYKCRHLWNNLPCAEGFEKKKFIKNIRPWWLGGRALASLVGRVDICGRHAATEINFVWAAARSLGRVDMSSL